MNHDEHEDREGHEGMKGYDEIAFGGHRMRLPSSLTPETERVMSATIGCAIAVHRTLGPGFLESIYRKAMCIELASSALSFESERAVRVDYRGVSIEGQRVDLIVEGLVVVELKAVNRLDDVHRSQLISYLRTLRLRAGLLVNFRVPVLRQGLKRVVL